MGRTSCILLGLECHVWHCAMEWVWWNIFKRMNENGVITPFSASWPGTFPEWNVLDISSICSLLCWWVQKDRENNFHINKELGVSQRFSNIRKITYQKHFFSRVSNFGIIVSGSRGQLCFWFAFVYDFIQYFCLALRKIRFMKVRAA